MLTVDPAEPDDPGLTELRGLLDAAFADRFSDHDFEHCRGGTHLRVRHDGVLVAHAAVVPRRLRVGDAMLRCGYVEAVAVLVAAPVLVAVLGLSRSAAAALVPPVGPAVRAAYDGQLLAQAVPLVAHTSVWALAVVALVLRFSRHR